MNEATRPVPVADAASRPSRGKGASIAREVASLIVSGELAPVTLLPTEHALARRHGASRPGIREAIRRLGSAGLVETRHGVGSLVTPPRLWKVFNPIVLNAHLDNRDLPLIVSELRDLRSMVEVEAAGIAPARISPQPLADPSAWLDRMGACLDDAERAARVGAKHVALTGAARPNAEALRHEVATVTDRPASFVPDVETVASETGLEAFLSMEAGEVA